MEFGNEINEYVKNIPQKIEHISGEEATKMALITPFLRLMGYDTADPSVVTAEYTADVGTKQGEKVDFAILDNGEPVVFIECKQVQKQLSKDNISQLFRYFSITNVRIGILTNGVEYLFYTTGKDNRMDDKPFMEINLLNLTKKDIIELEKFTRDNFNVDNVVRRANDLKYRNLIKKTLINEFKEPSDEFIRVIGKQIYDGVLTQNVKEKFGKIIVEVNTEIINEKVQKRLEDAVQNNDNKVEKETEEEISIEEETKQNIYTESSHLRNKSEKSKELYNTLKERIINQYEDIKIDPKVVYIAFKLNKNNVIDVGPKNDYLVIWINLKFDQIDDPLNEVRDVTSTGHHGNGDCEFKFKNIEDIDYVMILFKQSYEDKCLSN